MKDIIAIECPNEAKKDVDAVKKKWQNFKSDANKEFNLYKKSLGETGIFLHEQ